MKKLTADRIIYSLQQMVEDGLIEMVIKNDRRAYKLTTKGKKKLESIQTSQFSETVGMENEK